MTQIIDETMMKGVSGVAYYLQEFDAVTSLKLVLDRIIPIGIISSYG